VHQLEIKVSDIVGARCDHEEYRERLHFGGGISCFLVTFGRFLCFSSKL